MATIMMMMMIFGSAVLIAGIILILFGDEWMTPEDEYKIHKYFQGSEKDV